MSHLEAIDMSRVDCLKPPGATAPNLGRCDETVDGASGPRGQGQSWNNDDSRRAVCERKGQRAKILFL